LFSGERLRQEGQFRSFFAFGFAAGSGRGRAKLICKFGLSGVRGVAVEKVLEIHPPLAAGIRPVMMVRSTAEEI